MDHFYQTIIVSLRGICADGYEFFKHLKKALLSQE